MQMSTRRKQRDIRQKLGDIEHQIMELERGLFWKKDLKNGRKSSSPWNRQSFANEKLLSEMNFSLSSSTSAVLLQLQGFVEHSYWLEGKHKQVKQFVSWRTRPRSSKAALKGKKKINKIKESLKKHSIHSADTSVQMKLSSRKRLRRRQLLTN